MARPLTLIERVLLRLPEGTLARIAAVLSSKEDRASFIRSAVEAELRRREKRLSTQSQKPDLPVKKRDRR